MKTKSAVILGLICISILLLALAGCGTFDRPTNLDAMYKAASLGASLNHPVVHTTTCMVMGNIITCQ